MIDTLVALARKTLPSKLGFMVLGAMAAGAAHKELTERARIDVETELVAEHEEQQAELETELAQLRARLAALEAVRLADAAARVLEADVVSDEPAA